MSELQHEFDGLSILSFHKIERLSTKTVNNSVGLLHLHSTSTGEFVVVMRVHYSAL
jgi:hypothetical protein